MSAKRWTLSHPLQGSWWYYGVGAEPDGTFWVVGPCTLGNPAALASSRDGGRSWVSEDLVVRKDLARVRCAPNGELWITGAQGTLLARRGGAWKRLRVGTKSHLRGSCFGAAGRAWVTGSGGLIAHTADHGKTWRLAELDVAASLNDVAHDGHGALVAVGMKEVIYRSDDGLRWEPVDLRRAKPVSGLPPSFVRVIAWAPASFLLVGSDRVLTSRDGGHTWRDVTPKGVSDLTTACVTEDGRWYVGGLLFIARSDDQGATWEIEHHHDQPSHAWVYDLHVTAEGRGVAVGPHNTGWLRAP